MLHGVRGTFPIATWLYEVGVKVSVGVEEGAGMYAWGSLAPR